MKEFFQLVIGTDNYPMYAAQWFFACVGVVVSLLIETTTRKPNSNTSPVDFSWKYLWSDNVKRLLLSVLLLFIFLRFTNELLGIQITLFIALGLGLGLDKLSEYLKKKNILGIGQ